MKTVKTCEFNVSKLSPLLRRLISSAESEERLLDELASAVAQQNTSRAMEVARLIIEPALSEPTSEAMRDNVTSGRVDLQELPVKPR